MEKTQEPPVSKPARCYHSFQPPKAPKKPRAKPKPKPPTTCVTCVFFKPMVLRQVACSLCRRYPEHVLTEEGLWCGEYQSNK